MMRPPCVLLEMYLSASVGGSHSSVGWIVTMKDSLSIAVVIVIPLLIDRLGITIGRARRWDAIVMRGQRCWSGGAYAGTKWNVISA